MATERKHDGGEILLCPYCGSDESVKKGSRRGKPIRLCKGCRRLFTIGARYRKYRPVYGMKEKICLACKRPYLPRSHWKSSKYCSHRCSIIGHRPRLLGLQQSLKRRRRVSQVNKHRAASGGYKRLPPGVWSIAYTSCMQCGTTERPHEAKGMCKLCYEQVKREKQRNQRMDETLDFYRKFIPHSEEKHA